MSLEIFRAGKRKDGNGTEIDFSESMLAASAASYDPAIHEAPLVLGHPKHNDPAYGWVASLFADGPTLRCEPRQVEAEFSELVSQGRYKKISASFYLPGSPHHPIPESKVPYLRHVGFLGAQPPVIKGMANPEFCEFGEADDEGIFFCEEDLANVASDLSRLFRGLRDWLLEKEGVEAADRVIPSWSIDALTRTELSLRFRGVAEEIAGGMRQGAERTIYSEESPMPTELEAREASLLQRETAIAQKEALIYCEGLLAEGRGGIAGIKSQAVALLSQSAESTVEFAEAETPVSTLVRQILEAFPKDVVFGEVAPASTDAKPGKLDSKQLKGKALALMAKMKAEGNPIEWSEAVRMVAKENGMEEPE
jgi:hypothetical protein